MSKAIRNWNANKIWHGYQEDYRGDQLTIRVTYNNGDLIGYGEWHSPSGLTNATTYYIK